MKRKFKYYQLTWLKHDLPAGLSVFLVALPLCLGIALASGAPPSSGLLSGIIGGLVVSLISGSQLSVSGPAAGLTTVISAALFSLGDFDTFLLAVIIAGVFQIVLSLLKLGMIANYFPSSVIKGMLSAIGIILISKQIPILIGYDRPDFWESGFLHVFTRGDLNSLTIHTNVGVILISIISLSILILSRAFQPRFLKIVPAPLLVVLSSVFLALILAYPVIDLPVRQSQFVQIPSSIISNIHFPKFSGLFSNVEIWRIGLSVGLLASLETMLGVEAIDKLDKHNRITPINRELFAQGVGNILCGLLGAIPLTAVLVRGAANIEAGAKTKLSAFTHGLFLLLAVSLIPTLLNKIPFAALASILLLTGYNLTRPALFSSMWRLGLKQFLPFVLTILVILLTDLLVGVGIGLLLSGYFIIQNNFKAEYRILETIENGITTYRIKLNSNVTFLNKVNLRKSLDSIKPYSVLVIDGSECNFIDHDILEIVSEYSNKAHDRHIELILKGIKKVETASLH